jgi:beta-lactamase superfamily II metal-dependent hydrolase
MPPAHINKDISIYFLPVKNADAIHLRFPDSAGRWNNVLIDGGVSRSFDKTIRPLMERLEKAGESIDLWVLTHWDNDHIEGATKFLSDPNLQKTKFIREVWFNANYRLHKAGTSGYIGKKEGVLLRDYLENDLKIPSPVITSETSTRTVSGLIITPVSPEPEVYREAMSQLQAFAPVGRNESDHAKKLKQLYTNRFYADHSLPNRSSIALLLEYGDFRCLLPADASPLDLLSRLRSMGFSKENPLKVDLVKVAHHGSKRNTSDELLELLQCDRFVFTADGSDPHKFPDKETLARILLHDPCRTTTMHLCFNHRNPILENIFAADGADVMERLNFEVHFPKHETEGYVFHVPALLNP